MASVRDGQRFDFIEAYMQTQFDGEISARATHRNRSHHLQLHGSKDYRIALWTNFDDKSHVQSTKFGPSMWFDYRKGHEESRNRTQFDGEIQPRYTTPKQSGALIYCGS